LRKRLVAASAALILGPLSAAVYAAIPVEQIEAYEDYPTDTAYAPIHFGSSPTITVGQYDQGGGFPFITFTALTNTSEGSSTFANYSNHAYSVGIDMYGGGTVAYPYVTNPSVTDVYAQAYDTFALTQLGTQNGTGYGPLPSNFPTGVKVVNNSYVYSFTTTGSDTDAYRRLDYLINQDNVTFVTGAVSSDSSGDTFVMNWSSFNCLAVSGSSQPFNPSVGTGKQHADLYLPGDASYSAATVSSYATALYGYANATNQSDGMNTVVNRSLLMAGTDKTVYSPTTANHLDLVHGAGEPDFDTSMAILQAGEKPFLNVSSGSVTGSPSTTQDGWSYGKASASGRSVVLFSSANVITGLTASLNWNVTSPVTGSQVNTSVVNFPSLTLQVIPATSTGGGNYTLGANQSNSMLYSIATGDNVQYLYDTTSLPAGTYAFVIGGDPSLSPYVGLSYTLAGSFATQWNSSTGSSWGTAGNWTNGIPNGKAAQANLLVSPGLTSAGVITLDGDRTVGQLTFNNSNGYTIATGTVPNGTSGALTIDDTGDSSGTINPLITVLSGSQTISAAVNLVNGVTINISSAGSLNLSGGVSGSGSFNKSGSGNLTLSSTITASSFDFKGGTTYLTSTGSLNSGAATIESGSTLNLGASTSSGFLVRTLPALLTINNGATLTVTPAASTSNRQLIVADAGISLAGTSGGWTGKIDLSNNDLDVAGISLATVTNEMLEGLNNGKWNGSGGILSSTAAANTTHLTALGVIQNNQSGTALFTASHQFDGTTPGAGDILIKYTYYGDANLDGKVDGSDYSLIDNGYINHLTGWYNGDFNYDGVVNGSDYTLIDNAFNSQGAAFTDLIASPNAIATAQLADLPTSVPEPAGFAVISVAMTALLGRRRLRLSRGG
jgi:hypothetical protein